MKMTSRDKELIILVISLGIVATAWFGGAGYINAKTVEAAAQKDALQSEYEERVQILEKKDEYLKDTVAFNEAFTMMLDRYPAEISQVSQILFVTEIEKSFDAKIPEVSYTDETELYTFESTESDNRDPYRLTMASVEIPIVLSYDKWKDFLDYVVSFQDKSIISDISVKWNEETGDVYGTVMINQFAIRGGNRVIKENDLMIPIGTDHIFKSGTALLYDGGAAE